MDGIGLDPLWRLGVALAVGLFIGTERERRKGKGPDRAPAGIRTFALVAILGGISSLIGTWMSLVSGLFVGAGTVASYVVYKREDPGLTTEVALMVTFVLGVVSIGSPGLALATGVVVAALLALRRRMHALVSERLSEQELTDGILFAVAAVVVLPLVPNRSMGPFGAFNPYTLWRLVVVMMAMTGAGYLARRMLGDRFGLAFAGLAGGFVSSSATIGAMGHQAKSEMLQASAIAGAAASTVATFVQMGLLVLAASPPLLARAAWPLGAGGGVALLYAALQTWHATKSTPPDMPPGGRAFVLRTALLFAGLVGVVSLLSALAQHYLGTTGLLVSTGLAAFADAHASASSAASLFASRQIDERTAVLAILLALTTNTVTKAVIARSTGPRRFFRRVALGLLLTLGASWLGFYLPMR